MRRFAIAAALMLACGVLTVGSADALTTPATGSFTCDVGGVASLKPGVPMSGQLPTAKWTMEKIHNAPIDGCDVSGVTGGKSVITGGELRINARLNPGASCDTLAASLSSVNKAVVRLKLTNTTTTTTTDPITGEVTTTSWTRTSAVVVVKSVTASQVGSDVLLTGVAHQSSSGNKPFGGHIVEVLLHGTGDCSIGPLTSLDLTGSTVSVHPAV